MEPTEKAVGMNSLQGVGCGGGGGRSTAVTAETADTAGSNTGLNRSVHATSQYHSPHIPLAKLQHV
jgi:hypothetical protein